MNKIVSDKNVYVVLFLFSAIAILSLAFRTVGPNAADQAPGIDTEQNRFTRVVLAQKLEEPMQFEILKDGRVLFAERKGKLKLYSPSTGKVTVVAEIPVSTKYKSFTGEITEAEDGLQGVILDPDYDTNHWIYLYYSQAGPEAVNVVARYDWTGDRLIESSKKIMLKVVVQREECCHVGGGMLFDKQKNLYLSTGDNTFSRSSSGFTPIDERPGQYPRDAQKSSGNTNDLRGKILRIHPEPDGNYTIPDGNLFPKGTPKTRPEIYTMGNRNPWRLTIDSRTGWLYWGEVGPDGFNDTVGRGPKAYDEFNMAKQAGNFGWPYMVADNKAYWYYDFATGKSGEKFDPAHPVNHSPNNTGLVDLPPAQPAMIWYPYIVSDEFPVLGSGSRSATGGPIYRRANFKNPTRPFPNYYEGKWFVTDWARGWIVAITLGEDGMYKSMERFLPKEIFRGPIDMDFGPDGDLYVLEYGNGYFADNPEAELVKIEFNGGNRKPVVQASADKKGGAVPFKVQLSSSGTQDFDRDPLSYEWNITSKNSAPKTFKQPNPVVTITTPGVYTAMLTVTDSKGAKNSQSVQITAGNEPPVVGFDFKGGNKSFYFPGKKIDYIVNVNDKEDGSLANGRITPAQVAVTIDYLSEGYDQTVIASNQRGVDASVRFATAQNLISKSDCKACHNIDKKSLGPAFTAVAFKYKGDIGAGDRLTKKIISGGSGVWGDAAMPAHPAFSTNDAATIVKYILSLSEKQTIKSRPIKGTYLWDSTTKAAQKGNLIFRAAYRDKGTKAAAAQTAEEVLVLRNPIIPVSNVDKDENIEFAPGRARAMATGPSSYVEINKIDLTAIDTVEFAAGAFGAMGPALGGTIEIRLDSPTGTLIGTTPEINPAQPGGARRGGRGSRVKAGITPVTGMHDVYFVFVNKKAKNTDITISLSDIKFDTKL
ncbi:MAG: PQQ-dependent sugar dehydrogenase [Bacteroidota bacterium]|nr:PQQ-dependent sugar dehydrogenase [Bacteroidota bacterium]